MTRFASRTALLICLTLLLHLVSALLFSSSAQAQETSNDLGMWNTVVLQIPIGERFQLNTLTQMRNNNNMRDADRFLQFADINYYLDKGKHWSIGAGYAWTPTFNPDFRNENRIYEQAIFQHPIPTGQLFIRNRLEQRFIKDTGAVAQWGRTLVQYTHPFKKFPAWYLTASNEVLVQLYNVRNGPKGGLDQNRTYLALGKNINQHVRMEGGYLLIWQHRPGASQEGLNHLIMAQMTLH